MGPGSPVVDVRSSVGWAERGPSVASARAPCYAACMSAARTERLLNLLTLLLNSRRPISFREIRRMQEFMAYETADPKSGERAFERDKASLLEAGVPLRWLSPEELDDEDGIGGYAIDRHEYYLPDLELDAAELALLSIGGAAAAAIDGFPGKASILRALGKLGFDLDGVDGPTGFAHVPLRAGLDAKTIGKYLELLHGAVARRARVEMSYRGRSREPTQRRVDPWGLYYRQGLWYLVGYCNLRQEGRTFHLGRIESLELTRGQQGSGHFEVPEDFDISAHARRRPWEYPQHEPVTVRIALAEKLVPAVGEIFGEFVEVETATEGARVTLQVSNRNALMEAVLPHGAAAEVIEPADIRQELAGIYRELATRYEKGRAS